EVPQPRPQVGPGSGGGGALHVAAHRLDPVAVAEAGRRHRQQPLFPDQARPWQLPHGLQDRPVHHRPAKLDRHRPSLDPHLGGPGHPGRLRHRSAGVPGQAHRAVGGPGRGHVPLGGPRRPAVRPVAQRRALRHVAGTDPALSLVHPAPVDLDPLGLLQGDPLGDGAGGPGRRGHPVAGLPQGHRPAGRPRGLHGCHPHVLLRLERLHLRHLAHGQRQGPPGPCRARLFHGRLAVPAAGRGHLRRRRRGDRAGRRPRPRLPAQDRRRSHLRRRQGL
ncbi:MAG: Maltodextrin ABC transporter, permease protein MdxG, partial [uncultured Acidimicrobiales bacterium]